MGRPRTYQWLGKTQLLGERVARKQACALVGRLEEAADEVAGGAGVRGGAEGQQHEGHVQGCEPLVRREGVVRCLSTGGCLPRDFISWVQTWISSCISSGATSLRDHASSQRGLGGATGAASCPTLEAAREGSLDLKTFLKKGIVVSSPPGCRGGGREGGRRCRKQAAQCARRGASGRCGCGCGRGERGRSVGCGRRAALPQFHGQQPRSTSEKGGRQRRPSTSHCRFWPGYPCLPSPAPGSRSSTCSHWPRFGRCAVPRLR